MACVDVDGRHLVRSYVIGGDGALTPTGQTDMGANPCHLSTDRTGRFLLAAYYSDGMVTVDPIDAEGAVGGDRIQKVETQLKAHYIQTDASNRFAFVPHVGDANCVYQFRFDQNTVQLTPNDPPPVSPEPRPGPPHLCLLPPGLPPSPGLPPRQIATSSSVSDVGCMGGISNGWRGGGHASTGARHQQSASRPRPLQARAGPGRALARPRPAAMSAMPPRR